MGRPAGAAPWGERRLGFHLLLSRLQGDAHGILGDLRVPGRSPPRQRWAPQAPPRAWQGWAGLTS